MRAIKEFCFDDTHVNGELGLGALEKNVKPGFMDAHKKDFLRKYITDEGLFVMREWLESDFGFITTSNTLYEKTYQRLLDQVNFEIPLEEVKALLKDPVVAPVTEFINNHANPLYCKDELYNRGRAIMMKKNHDYTGGSGDPYANFRGSDTLGISPITGILLRVQDKLMRIKTFDEKGELKVENEGVEDALIDVQNYMDLIYGLIKEARNDNDKS
jgi:hypothetical protein